MQSKTIAWLGSTAVAILLILALWILPLLLTPAETVRFIGEKRAFDMDLSKPDPRTFTWDYEVKIKDPDDFDITPSLPWDLRGIRTPDHSGLTFALSICIYVNDQQINFHAGPVEGLPGECLGVLAESGGISSRVGYPLPEQMPQDQFRPGVNKIRVEAIARALDPAPSSIGHIELGPVRSLVVARDANHDAVADAYQPIPAIHAGVSAVVIAIAGAVATYVALGRWLARKT